MKKLACFLGFFLSVSSAFAAGRLVTSPRKDLPAGSIVIHMKERALYFILDSRAIRYPVAVAKRGMEWSGYAHVTGTYSHPAWAPPAVVRRDHPELPDYIPGGAPNNPMGAAALTLDRSEIAIHGTAATMRGSIGTAASYGCVRMYNEDISDLYQRVSVGALVSMER